ncbi:MAG TPA: lysoplasmalogenase [Ferruginibacter sp.]|nr:lysoplasmalogenase [Ferruginibacter sp.]
MKNKTQTLSIIFWIIAAVDIIGIAADISILHYVAKPFLVPVLMILLTTATGVSKGKGLMLAALFFSWLGDMFLLFESKQELFFIFGLVCFLTTHIFYIIYFLRISSSAPSLLKKQPLLILVVVAYGFGLVWLLFPHLGELKLPVIIYAIVICSMLLCSLRIFLKLNRAAAILYLCGAAAFVLSDSLLAINKFYQPFAYAGVFIMLTYCMAQYFIVRGYTAQQSESL